MTLLFAVVVSLRFVKYWLLKLELEQGNCSYLIYCRNTTIKQAHYFLSSTEFTLVFYVEVSHAMRSLCTLSVPIQTQHYQSVIQARCPAAQDEEKTIHFLWRRSPPLHLRADDKENTTNNKIPVLQGAWQYILIKSITFWVSGSAQVG